MDQISQSSISISQSSISQAKYIVHKKQEKGRRRHVEIISLVINKTKNTKIFCTF
jgi:DNA-binding transcriptional regulator GbsR (MarR family)